MTTQEYKDIIDNNGYINKGAVIEFLRNNMIADYEVVADIFGKGISMTDYYNLQKALDELENEIKV